MKSITTILEEVKAEYTPIKESNPDALFYIIDEKAEENELNEDQYNKLCSLCENI